MELVRRTGLQFTMRRPNLNSPANRWLMGVAGVALLAATAVSFALGLSGGCNHRCLSDSSINCDGPSGCDTARPVSACCDASVQILSPALATDAEPNHSRKTLPPPFAIDHKRLALALAHSYHADFKPEATYGSGTETYLATARLRI